MMVHRWQLMARTGDLERSLNCPGGLARHNFPNADRLPFSLKINECVVMPPIHTHSQISFRLSIGTRKTGNSQA